MQRRIPSSAGKFGIKLVGHDFPEYPFFRKDTNPALMCFPDSEMGRHVASVIPIGHRSLVYLMAPVKRIWAAVEYIKTDPIRESVLDEGRRAAIKHGAIKILKVVAPHYASYFRCVRFVAEIEDPANVPTPDFGFSQGDVGFDIDEADYLELYNAKPWTWTAV